jgi:hypothetical protein
MSLLFILKDLPLGDAKVSVSAVFDGASFAESDGVSELNAGIPAGRCPVDRLNRLRLNGFGELYQVICGYSGKQL